ncbi:MAG: SRPBCC family protein [Gemmatales bacterium]|nr:SRPBCC family protein [Gemmatales bacterium]MDW7993672.1 SRPBCC family protein [Gemmatales bacterium]
MRIYKFEMEQWVARSTEEVFAFFSDPFNLDRITPPWLRFQTTEAPKQVYRNCLLVHQLRIHGVPVTWVSQIVEWDPPRRFIDVQVIGPYQLWHHVHEFVPEGGGTRIRDVVCYALPFGWLGRWAHFLFVRRDLEQIFAYRRQQIERYFAPAADSPATPPGEPRAPA